MMEIKSFYFFAILLVKTTGYVVGWSVALHAISLARQL